MTQYKTNGAALREPSQPELRVQVSRHSGGEFQFPPFEDHLLSLHLGDPITLEHGQNAGRSRQERMICGSIVVVPAGQPSFWRHSEASFYLNLHLSRTLLDRTAEQMGLDESGLSSEADSASFHDPQMEQIVLLLRTEMEAGAPHGSLYAEMLTSALCVRLLQHENECGPARHPSEQISYRAELRQAVIFIQDNLAADLSLGTLAQKVGLSSYHFAHLFTGAFGIAPHQYVIQARIEWAKALMTRGLPLGDTAHQVGFSDQSHFTRHFKRLVGITPHAFVRDADRKIVP